MKAGWHICLRAWSPNRKFRQPITFILKEKLLANNQFLLLICKNIAGKLSAAMMRDAVSSSISERVWNYMQFKCENGILKGLEKTAFQLHCSERQLQRIMNEFQSKGMIEKIGKGTYQIKTREEPKKRDWYNFQFSYLRQPFDRLPYSLFGKFSFAYLPWWASADTMEAERNGGAANVSP